MLCAKMMHKPQRPCFQTCVHSHHSLCCCSSCVTDTGACCGLEPLKSLQEQWFKRRTETVCPLGGATEIATRRSVPRVAQRSTATVRCVPWVAQRRLRPCGVSPGWRNGDCDQAECPTGGAAEYCDREECSRAAQRSLRSRVVCDEPLRCRLANAFYRRWSLTSLLGPGSDDTGNRLLR